MNAKISVPEIEAKNTSGEKNSTASKELNDKIKQVLPSPLSFLVLRLHHNPV